MNAKNVIVGAYFFIPLVKFIIKQPIKYRVSNKLLNSMIKYINKLETISPHDKYKESAVSLHFTS